MRTFSSPSHRLIAALLLVTAADCRDEGTGATPQDLSAIPDLTQTPTTDLAFGDLSTGDLSMAREPTEFMVVRVGDGTAALTSAATAAFVERRKISDGMLVGTPIALPTMVNGTTKRLTLGGSTVSEGALSRSANGAYVLIAGYDAALATTGPSMGALGTSASSTVNRVIGRIAADNSVDTTTAFDAFTGQSIRGAASTDGQALWASTGSGIGYTTRTSTAAPTILNSTNSRVLGIFGGQLYATSGAGSNVGVNSVGTGTPMTTGTTLTLLTGFSAQMNSPSPYGFVAFDRDSTPGIDTLYVADDRTTGGGLQKWTFAAGTWTLGGTFTAGTGTYARSVTGYVSGNNVVLLTVIPEVGTAGARVVSFVDNGQTPSMIAAMNLATAGNNTSYRGIALAPE